MKIKFLIVVAFFLAVYSTSAATQGQIWVYDPAAETLLTHPVQGLRLCHIGGGAGAGRV